MSGETLRECPWCGGEACIAEDDGVWIVACREDHKCPVAPSHIDNESREATIAAWNHRASDRIERASAEGGEERRDAERYRWLRDGQSIQIFGLHEKWVTSHRLDQIVDAAMNQESK